MKLRGIKSVIKRHPVPVWPEIEQPTVWQYKKSGPSAEESHESRCECPDCIIAEIDSVGTSETETKKAKKKKPGAFSLITSKPAPAPGKRKIILED